MQRDSRRTTFPEPEDHLAVELAFMARLCEQAAGALRRAGEGQAAEDLLGGQLAFLRDHLLRWIRAVRG